jgi:cellulose synthase/poly-beta-1,6-N-acetylglucosamine synthase-like glycosyltransferase/peptidoglycan/xylan/chitin deacetylase (PgdA/CDA1 family)
MSSLWGRSIRRGRVAELRRRARRPPSHRLAGLLLASGLLLVLLVNGLSTHTTAPSSTNDPDANAPLAGSSPLLTADGGDLQPRQPATGRRVALTFDDGPDPVWTPRIAATLERLDVPATFYVLGSAAARHPDVVRDLHERGFELGNHTFNHADLAAIPGWQRGLQLSLTETAIAGAAGVRPRLVRPPYSSTVDAVTAQQGTALADLAGGAYVIALSEIDSRDWQRRGVDRIVRAATPRGKRGGIVLLHDGGGDRSQTLAAVERLVPRLRERGFRFVSTAQLLGLPRAAVEIPASGWERLQGKALIAALGAARWLAGVMTALLIALGVLTVLRFALVLVFARRHEATTRARAGVGSFTPPVSIVVPAFNEAVDIEHSVRSLARTDYPSFEVVVVDDGSTDGTGEIVERLALPGVRVVRQENAGKAEALNTGLLAARHEVVAMVDADTVFEPQTLRRLVAPLHDPRVAGVAGNTKIANRNGLLGRWQHIEYVMGFNLERRMYQVLGCMPTVPGAVGAFRKAALTEIGGISGATLAEDTDITLAIGRAGWRVAYADDARAWTDAPATLGDLWRQRYRWSFGTLQAVWKHRAALWRRGEGRIGRRALPFLLLFQIVLPLLGPLVDVFAVYGLLFLDPWAVLAFWGGFTLLQLLIAIYGFRLDGEPLTPLWALPLQQLVYRQLMYLVLIESALSAVRGMQIGWHRVRRTGQFDLAPGETADQPAGRASPSA